MVGTGPDIDEDQRPEVHDRQPVAEHRAVGGLREVVVHQPEERRGEEERHRVVAVPPLHQRILHAGVGRVAAEQRVRDGDAVPDVQDGHRDDRRDVEPDRDVDVLLAADGDGAEEVDREGHPQHGDDDVEHPGELGVFLALRVPRDERQGRGHDQELPPVEVQRRERIAEEACLQQALHRVIGAGEDDVAAEREDDGVRVQRPQPAEGEVGSQVQAWHEQHGRDEHADEHADDGPEQSRHEEEPRGAVVVAYGLAHRILFTQDRCTASAGAADAGKRATGHTYRAGPNVRRRMSGSFVGSALESQRVGQTSLCPFSQGVRENPDSRMRFVRNSPHGSGINSRRVATPCRTSARYSCVEAGCRARGVGCARCWRNDDAGSDEGGAVGHRPAVTDRYKEGG